MARIAFILLCHKDPDAIVRQAHSLTASGDYLSIHFDKSAPEADFRKIRAQLADNPNVTFARRRLRCGWGEWSLVAATLEALRAAEQRFPKASHFYMVSGDCMPIKSSEYARAFLDARDADYIESFDYFESGWIKTGMQKERLIYRHFLNERKHKRLFYASLELQRRLGLARALPRDLEMMIGSQWWCLRRRSVEAILRFVDKRPDVIRFFRTTWIPDETFFQTLTRHLVPGSEIESRTLTFLMFSDYGMPVTFYNDHHDLLLAQGFLFARKISPDATDLKTRLNALWSAKGAVFDISNEGRALYSFVTSRGREGRRFGRRFWETEASLGRERELLVLICKKYKVARRLAAQINQHTDIPALGYIFHDEAEILPNLGGLQTTLSKRHRHRNALLRMLYGHYHSNRLLICVDPRSLDLITEFAGDIAQTRFLEIDTRFSEDYLIGHALRAGLATEHTPNAVLDALLVALRNDLRHEQEALRAAEIGALDSLRETDPPEANARTLAGFLRIEQDRALDILRTRNLFED